MARLQILELPEGTGDDRPPFILVLDQAPRDESSSAFRDDLVNNEIANRTGARHVLVFEDTIDIPANDTTAYLQQVAEETGATIGKITSAYTAQTLAGERTDITREMYQLAKWKQALADALGMDRTGDWDDIRNAAAGLRKERDAQAEAIERVCQESARIRATTRTWEPVADLIDAALNGNQATAVVDKGESTGRPTHPDGTPYRYHEIKDGGWHHCDGCRTWGQWTAEKPHDCINSQTAQTMNPNRDA